MTLKSLTIDNCNEIMVIVSDLQTNCKLQWSIVALQRTIVGLQWTVVALQWSLQ
ncbi:hypothetical protein [Niastella sp. OAS944]|uniref:hypothetical protein n=1 Tax=Niastella sp. OAS944 TaxID=2664089 RepID=UPI003481E802|nr:hypothetical protein [Chitinophagaceae bacterium OAS944]